MENSYRLKWESLLNEKRRKDKFKQQASVKDEPDQGGVEDDPDKDEDRTELERDHDRILFSTPVRRLADKTQVFPLEKHDAVRTRLTHSLEVSNLARSIGVNIAFNNTGIQESLAPKRNIPSLLAAIGLAHDLGNPPFGHQGEATIRAWFEENEPSVFKDQPDITAQMRNDFFKFEGNAQTLRLVTRLQILNDDFGLNLTYGTLAALMKYTVDSGSINEDIVSCKKHGFFQSEKEIVKDIWEETGLSEGQRHPLTFIMEASDDIAYSVLDTEDAVKKGLASFYDVIMYLEIESNADPVVAQVIKAAKEKHDEYSKASLSPAELNDVSMQRFRVFAISAMVRDVVSAYKDNYTTLMNAELEQDLISVSKSAILCDTLKAFCRSHAFKHRSVVEIELIGDNVMKKLMDLLWRAIIDRVDPMDPKSKRKSRFSHYVYNRISEGYRRVFENGTSKLPIRYREAQLLTDMMSGMTDTFALSLYKELKKLR